MPLGACGGPESSWSREGPSGNVLPTTHCLSWCTRVTRISWRSPKTTWYLQPPDTPSVEANNRLPHCGCAYKTLKTRMPALDSCSSDYFDIARRADKHLELHPRAVGHVAKRRSSRFVAGRRPLGSCMTITAKGSFLPCALLLC